MTLEKIATSAVSWLWDQYGKTLTDKAFRRFQKKWREFRWEEAESRYRVRVREQYNTTHLFGYPKPLTVEDLYVDVFILDKPSAFRRHELSALKGRPVDQNVLNLDNKRRPALRLALAEKRLFILGKPGSGKTTFLKYLVMQACAGKIAMTPIFVSLKEWSDSGLELIPFLIQLFEICAFPNAQAFVEHILKQGNVIVLFDGLDEVNQEGEKRAQMITKLSSFAKQYPMAHICVTCRIAATDYSFDQFTYVEIADFDERQIRLFVGKWYQGSQIKQAQFFTEFDKPKYKGLRELAQTPLLSALLCLVFEDQLAFPTRQVDLYKDALDILLRKWDASRGIKRDETYRQISLEHKRQLLAYLANENFNAGAYFIQKETLERQIVNYLQLLFTTNKTYSDSIESHGNLNQTLGSEIVTKTTLDGEEILRTIEMQHGILVERAHNIYSFSHLAFQEYFTARYIVDDITLESLRNVIRSHSGDNRWHEVFFNVLNLFDKHDLFFNAFLTEVANLAHELEINFLLIDNAQIDTRAAYLLITIIHQQVDEKLRKKAIQLASVLIGEHNINFHDDEELSRRLSEIDKWENNDSTDNDNIVMAEQAAHEVFAGRLADRLAIRFNIPHTAISKNRPSANHDRIRTYLDANLMLLECMKSATGIDHGSIKSQMLLPKALLNR